MKSNIIDINLANAKFSELDFDLKIRPVSGAVEIIIGLAQLIILMPLI